MFRLWNWQLWLGMAGGLLLIYLATAYVLLPWWWKRYTHRHPALADIPGITHTGSGIPGDPLNVALVGTEADVLQALHLAHWFRADPLSLKSCLGIAEASILKHPYAEAPVSNLFLFGRREDLAFEQPVGNNPRERHHVRFWQTDRRIDGQPVWVGSAVFDRRVGLSRTTGQITHVTAVDVDQERDYLFQCLKDSGQVEKFEVMDDFHQVREGKNGGGDPWRTDGNLWVGFLKPAGDSAGAKR